MSAIVQVASVTKRFKKIQRRPGVVGAVRDLVHPKATSFLAVDQVSFAVNEGDAVGYLGPNGSGKSTMLKLLTGVLIPDEGMVQVLGRVPHLMRRQNAREIGVIFGQRTQLWWDLPVRDSFEVHRAIYGLSRQQFATSFDELVELLDLGPFLNQPARQLSLGQRMRADIALSLIHSPKVLFLDEPTIGIDIVGKTAIRTFLRRLKRTRATTIILTSHDLQDIEQVCGRVLIVDSSKLVFEGSIGDLRRLLPAQRKLVLHFREDPGELAIRMARLVSDQGTEKHYLLDDPQLNILDVVGSVASLPSLHDLSLTEPSIEDILGSFYRGARSAGV